MVCRVFFPPQLCTKESSEVKLGALRKLLQDLDEARRLRDELEKSLDKKGWG